MPKAFIDFRDNWYSGATIHLKPTKAEYEDGIAVKRIFCGGDKVEFLSEHRNEMKKDVVQFVRCTNVFIRIENPFLVMSIVTEPGAQPAYSNINCYPLDRVTFMHFTTED